MRSIILLCDFVMLNKAGIWMTGSPDRPQCLTTLLAVRHNSAAVRDGDSNAPGGRNAQCINQVIAHLIISGSATLTAVAPQYHSYSVCVMHLIDRALQQCSCPATSTFSFHKFKNLSAVKACLSKALVLKSTHDLS